MISWKRWKNGDITEDELRSGTEDVQKATDNSIKEIDQMIADKEKILCQYKTNIQWHIKMPVLNDNVTFKMGMFN